MGCIACKKRFFFGWRRNFLPKAVLLSLHVGFCVCVCVEEDVSKYQILAWLHDLKTVIKSHRVQMRNYHQSHQGSNQIK